MKTEKVIGLIIALCAIFVAAIYGVAQLTYNIGVDNGKKVFDKEKNNLYKSNVYLTSQVEQLQDCVKILVNNKIYGSTSSKAKEVYEKINKNEVSAKNNYNYSKSNIRFGTAFIDPKTKVTMSILSANIENIGKAYASAPGIRFSFNNETFKVKPGENWSFKYDGNDYLLIVTEINWLRETFGAKVAEVVNN